MKQTLLLFLISFLSFQLSAQVTLTLVDSPASAVGTKDDDAIIAKATIKNESSEKKLILWERTIISITEGWGTAVCDKNLCYDPSIDAFEFELDSLEEASISIYGYPRGVEGATTVQLKLTDAADATNTVTGQFEVQSDGFTTSTRFVERPDVKIYPNPTTEYISLTDAQYVDRLVIHNIVGRPIQSFPVNYSNQYDVSRLPVGMYLVRLVDKNDQTLKTIRLSLNHP